MKSRNFMKSGVAIGLALSMVAGSAVDMGTIHAAAKPKLNKKKLSVTKGDTATLTVKKAKKKVKWSTSKKKIVKITKVSGKKKSQAVIKGVKPGKAVVTAKVGKKKLTCKVTVKKPVDNFKTTAVDIFDQNCVELTLNKADAKHPVTEANLSVTTKKEKSAPYNKANVVTKVTKVSSTKYRVYLQDSLSNGDFVQLKSGVSTAESQVKLPLYAKEDIVYLSYEKGSTVNVNLGDYVANAIGATKVSFDKGSTLPDGLTLDSKFTTIKGIPTTAGNTSLKATVKDELGRKATLNVVFGIYDETVISAEDLTEEIHVTDAVREQINKYDEGNKAALDEDKEYYTSYTIAPKGGSGTYKFTLETPDDANVRLSTDSYANDAAKTLTQKSASSTELKVPYSLLKADGTHTYKVTATDVVDPTRTYSSTITIKVDSYHKLSGVVKSSNGQRITGTTVTVIPEKASSINEAVKSEINLSTVGQLKGGDLPGYEVEVPAGNYIVKVQGDVNYQMNGTIKVGKENTIANVTVPAKFYSVSAMATYANKDNKLKNKTVYFEAKNSKFENISFTTETDEEGNYNIALPTNTYYAYIKDEKGNRKYFGSTINVKDRDLILNSMAASISRYCVEGVIYNGTSTDATINMADAICGADLYFYKPNGEVITASTKDNGSYKVYLEADTTYVVRVYFGGALRTLGALSVAQENLAGANLTYNSDTEVATAKEYLATTLGTEDVLNSTGANDLVWKFTPSEAGLYKFRSTTALNKGKKIYVYDENKQVIATYSDRENVNDMDVVDEDEDGYNVKYNTNYAVATLEAGKVYFVKVVPNAKNGDTAQGTGDVYLTIDKYIPATPSPTIRPTRTPGYDDDYGYATATPTVRPGDDVPEPTWAPTTDAPSPTVH